MPPLAARAGQTHRVRVRHKDSTGRWSHWSAPLQFVAGTPDVSVYLNGIVVSQFMYHPPEPTGAETLVSARLGATEIVLAVRDRIEQGAGATLNLTYPAERLHLFDAETGLRLD